MPRFVLRLDDVDFGRGRSQVARAVGVELRDVGHGLLVRRFEPIDRRLSVGIREAGDVRVRLRPDRNDSLNDERFGRWIHYGTPTSGGRFLTPI